MQDLWIQRHQKSKPGCSRGNSTLFSYTATIVQSEFRPRHILNWVVCTCDNKYEIAPFFLTRNCNGWSRSFNVETKCWAQLRRTRSDKVRWRISQITQSPPVCMGNCGLGTTGCCCCCSPWWTWSCSWSPPCTSLSLTLLASCCSSTSSSASCSRGLLRGAGASAAGSGAGAGSLSWCDPAPLWDSWFCG